MLTLTNPEKLLSKTGLAGINGAELLEPIEMNQPSVFSWKKSPI
jgi:hypothetical protein